MLTVSSLSKELGGRPVIRALSFSANRGEVIGVVGPNGCGKTTLLRLLAGELQPDSGRIEIAPGLRIGHLPQGQAGSEGLALADAFPSLFHQGDAGKRLEAISSALAATADPAVQKRLGAEYDALLTSLAHGSADRVAAARESLGVSHFQAEQKVRELSGGELTRLGLVGVLAANPDVLLLDEPTNHLDLEGITWVERLIASAPGPVIVVSHDRALLDGVATHILALNADAGPAELFTGNYSEYAVEIERRNDHAWEAYRRQQREERQLRQNISAIESRSRGIENRTIDYAKRKKAAKLSRRSVTLKARLERQQEAKDHVDRPARLAMGFYGSFEPGERTASRLVSAERVRLEVAGRVLVENVTFQATRGERLAITGPNGCGKTTLIRALIGNHPVTGGRLEVAASARVGYLAQDDSLALPAAEAEFTPVELLRRSCELPERDVANLLHRFLFARGQVSTPVSRLSYGERRRLSLARLVLGGANLLLLDEPANHLDLPSREAFERALEGFDGCVIAVTHDRYFIERFADEVLDLGAFAAG